MERTPEDRNSSSINTNSDFENILQKYRQNRSILRKLGKLGKRIGTASLFRSVRPSIFPSEWNSATSTGPIFVKFHT